MNKSYVTVDSIDSLKNSIFENTIETDSASEGPNLATLANNFAKLYQLEESNGSSISSLKRQVSKLKITSRVKKAIPYMEKLP